MNNHNIPNKKIPQAPRLSSKTISVVDNLEPKLLQLWLKTFTHF